MLKYIAVLAICLFTIPYASANVSIQNDQMYLGDDGTLHIVGEIKNNLDVPLRQMEIQARLYSDSGKLIETRTTSTLSDIIMPNMKTPFDLMIFDDTSKISKYSLDVNYEIASPKSQSIDIVSSNIVRDDLDNLRISGTVMNKGDITANSISIIATLYDNEGKVAAVSKILKPDYLRSDDQAFFVVSIIDKSQTYDISGYSLIAESEEYAAVPEFPIGTGALLAASVSGYLFLTRQFNRFKARMIYADYLE